MPYWAVECRSPVTDEVFILRRQSVHVFHSTRREYGNAKAQNVQLPTNKNISIYVYFDFHSVLPVNFTSYVYLDFASLLHPYCLVIVVHNFIKINVSNGIL